MTKNISQKIALIALLLISIFVLSLAEGKAQCPDNWGTNYTYDSITVNYGNNCVIKIYYCATYAEDGNYYIVYNKFVWDHNLCDPSFFNSQSFWVLAEETILDRYFNELGTHIGPCTAGGKYRSYINYGKAYCWKLVIEPTGFPPPHHKLMSYKNCSTPYSNEPYNFRGCLKSYTMCWDMTKNPPELITTYDFTQIDTPNCNQVGMPTYTVQQLNMLPVPYESECYFSSCEFVP